MSLLALTVYRLIKSELVALMGRTPTNKEIREFMKAVYDNTDENLRLSDVFSSLYDYLHDNYVECKSCNTWYKKEDMYTKHDEFDDGEYYCEDCVNDALELTADIHSEHGTDGKHTI